MKKGLYAEMTTEGLKELSIKRDNQAIVFRKHVKILELSSHKKLV